MTEYTVKVERTRQVKDEASVTVDAVDEADAEVQAEKKAGELNDDEWTLLDAGEPEYEYEVDEA